MGEAERVWRVSGVDSAGGGGGGPLSSFYLSLTFLTRQQQQQQQPPERKLLLRPSKGNGKKNGSARRVGITCDSPPLVSVILMAAQVNMRGTVCRRQQATYQSAHGERL